MGAGLGMSASEMTTLTLFPHQQSPALANMAGSGMGAMAMRPQPVVASVLAGWVLPITMWWVMMIAMMAPSAAPTILLYARVHRHSIARGSAQERLAPTGAFAGGYLLIWLGFSILAATLHRMMESSGIISDMGSRSQWLSAGVLIAAGLYQFSPLKAACLSHCRSPAGFLSRHWRPHATGALRLGAMHGAFCVGCCWVLMALLFVGGAMNLVWIAALSLLVLVEKFVPPGRWVGRGVGLLLVGWGVATMLCDGCAVGI
ncbi:MAG: DUF2182 domain-containing protein [Novosphingobium sp.]|nr:DUF2182 domain-containing protein [Novosphingobium sp.]